MHLDTITKGEELESKATPAPWRKSRWDDESCMSTDGVVGPANNPVIVTSSNYDLPGTSPQDAALVIWLRNHASELLQCAREVEENKAVDKAVDRVVNKYGDAMRNLANR